MLIKEINIYNQLRILILIICITSILSCVESYEFDTKNQEPGVVVESYISNKSYNDTKCYPSEGRYFKVLLKYNSLPSNVRDSSIANAIVMLESSSGSTWFYTEIDKGAYSLLDDDFKATYEQQYRLNITLPNNTEITSSWQKLPTPDTQLGEVHFEETILRSYIDKGDEKQLEENDGINVRINTTADSNQYYKWQFEPLWLYKAPYASIGTPGYQCWIKGTYYLNDYQLKNISADNSDANLFSLEITGNEKIYEYFSVLITQQVMNSNSYNFWMEMKEQNQNSGLFDEPPVSLQTNYTSSDKSIPVFGYFSVYTENATRWVFDKDKLSYPIENDLRAQCDSHICVGGPCPPPSCSDCLLYMNGSPTNSAPEWWEE
ncbi:DUF4249 domain-containing protein [Fulvivirga maritima]|uniref:DUF4249 family protein n=1 Tax=Fulvivirga maritima TaxID=2904247 RepID=UPI001F2A6F23|nr:DUF4249 family protein [Fulvivirga maritima]UII27986.1 DUF4249 domain-containing protein [Fulvivirga maritima]